jgi:phage-related protein
VLRGPDGGSVVVGIEIAPRHDGEAYRMVVALPLGRTIPVLHAFRKKSEKGIGVPKKDVDLIRQRYKVAKETPR